MSVTEDEIRLVVPAAPEFARLARLTVAGVATRVGFTYDEVEDLRIAVGEVCSLFIDSDPRGTLSLLFLVGDGTLDITIGSDGGGDPRASAEVGLSRQILESVVDSYEVRGDTIHLRKQRAAGQS